ncbi:MAG TPA: hypothetical protein PKD54_07065 [Pirellulaceae bacterium]|nr:hypothetical protein [Pirellulaceae bacterium]
MRSRNPASRQGRPDNHNRVPLPTAERSGRPQRAWKSSLLLFCILAGTGVAIVFLQKNVYRSEASIFVKLGRESVALDPTVTTTSTIALNETRESEINSTLEVLRSRAIAERVVDEFGPENILAGVVPGSGHEEDSMISRLIGSWIDELRRLNDGRDVSVRERATRRLLKNFEVTIPKKSTVLVLRYDTKSPDMAQQVLARIVEVFQEEHARINRVVGSYDFLLGQREVLEQRLETAQFALRAEKNMLRLVSIEGAKTKLQDEYALLSNQLIQATTELVASQAKIDHLQQELNELPDRLPAANVSGFPNEATDRMRESLYQLQIRERDLLAQYTDSHPAVVQVRKLVAEAEAIYEEQGQQREQVTTAIHPSKQNLELLYLTEKAQAHSWASRIEELKRQIELIQTEMASLTEGEIRIADLQREVDMAEGSLRNYSDRLEQARLDQELRSKNISNLNIVQPASYMEKPVGLPRIVLLLICLALAFFGSVGVLMVPELRRWFAPTPAASDTGSAPPPSDDSFDFEARVSQGLASQRYEQRELESGAENNP